MKTYTLMQARQKCHYCDQTMPLGGPVAMTDDDKLVHPSCLETKRIMETFKETS